MWELHPGTLQLGTERGTDSWTLPQGTPCGGDGDIQRNPKYVISIKRGFRISLDQREEKTHFCIKEDFTEKMKYKMGLEGQIEF